MQPYIEMQLNKHHIYKFPIIQNVYIYCILRLGLQEQIGCVAALMILKKADDKTFRNGIDDSDLTK